MSEFTARQPLPRMLEAGSDESVNLPIWLGAATVTPSSGTYTLYDESRAVVVSGAVTVTGGVATYAVAASLTNGKPYSDAWLEEWALIIGSVTKTFRVDAYLVRRKLYNVVSQADLVRRHSDIEQLLSPELSSYQPYIDEAWETFNADLIGKGNRPNLIMTPWATRACIVALTLAYVMRDFTTRMAEGDKFADLAGEYFKEYAEAWKRLTFRYDLNEDGESGKKLSASPVIFLSSTPRARRGGYGGLAE